MVDALKAGQFGFYKDSDLTKKLEDGELFDQMTADGWIDIWFGGKIFWIPDLGEFDIMAYCEQSFFWDIVDKDGNRNIHGFDEIQISRNEMVEPYYGDLVPLNPDEIFNISSPAEVVNTTTDLNAARIWWRNHMFRDEYYRYSAIALPFTAQTMNEIDAKILPINYNVSLPAQHYIYGFRPKFEYFSKLAVMRKIVSGDKGKIHFKLKVDLDYLSLHPDTERSIRLFTQTDDPVYYLPYQSDPDKIIWVNQRNDYKRFFLNYLLDNAIVMYLPDDGAFEAIESKYVDTMHMSNLVLNADIATLDLMNKDFDAMYSGEDRIFNGYTLIILDSFTEWLNENLIHEYNNTHQDGDIYSDPDKILTHTMLVRKYFKGFAQLADSLGLISIPKPYEAPFVPPYYPDQINTIVIKENGAREFSNGNRMRKAIDYNHNDDPLYVYEGEIGNGYYWIKGDDNSERTIYCNMTTDMGGWMFLFTSQNVLGEYFYNIYNMNQAAESQFSYVLGKGDSFTGQNEAILDAPWVNFNEIKISLFLERSSSDIVIHNSSGLLVRYDCSETTVIATYRDETVKTFPFGLVDDAFILPSEQTGLTIRFLNEEFDGTAEYISMLMVR